MNYDQTITYAEDHRLKDIYEAILSAMVVLKPEDPVNFMRLCMEFFDRYGTDRIEWNMFIPETYRPSHRIGSTLWERVFYEAGYGEPTYEMYQRAYSHYNDFIVHSTYNKWMCYHLFKQSNMRKLQANLTKARHHQKRRLQSKTFDRWKKWYTVQKGRQAIAHNLIKHVFELAMSRIVVKAWLQVTLDAKRTREYFERLERGEAPESDETETGDADGEFHDSLSQLPTNIRVKILQNLNPLDLLNAGKVCRGWKMLTQVGLLWTQLDFSEVGDFVTNKLAVSLLKRSRAVLCNLNLRTCHRLSMATFSAIGLCKNLQDLNLSECSGLDDFGVQTITKNCVILLFLNLAFNRITDVSLRAISHNCEHLQWLSLAHCRYFTDKGISYLGNGSHISRIAYLDLSGCIQLSWEGFAALGHGCAGLEILRLNEFPRLSDEMVCALLTSCENLRHVSFLGSPHVSDPTFNELARNDQLVSLKIDSNWAVSDASLRQIGRGCPKLRHVYITDCIRVTDATLRSFSRCKQLTVLNLSDCIQVTDHGVRAITESQSAPKLKELNLTNCLRITDVSTVLVHKKCTGLIYFRMCFCDNITETGLEIFGQSNNLVMLDITGCNCTDHAIIAIGLNPNLRTLSVSECSEITDLGLQKFAQRCAHIENLDLSFCYQLTDVAIKNLAFCCRMLTSLKLSGCSTLAPKLWNELLPCEVREATSFNSFKTRLKSHLFRQSYEILLTDLSVQYISGVCKHLVHLDLSGCTLVTDNGLRNLHKGCARLKTLVLLYCRSVTRLSALQLAHSIGSVQHSADEVPMWFGMQDKVVANQATGRSGKKKN